MKQILTALLLLVTSFAFAQNITISGKVLDADLLEPLIGATIKTADGKAGAVSDFNGDYSFTVSSGTHTIVCSYIGYNDVTNEIKASGTDIELNFMMGGSKALEEVVVTSDIAIDRKTPIAFSNIPTLKLKEELASQDIPMILNSTPGAYATQSGGGDGDARVSIRGFNQRNVAVMLDGVPVNDMENGQVYWSNWFGLDLVTKTMQVQRGLGASKLALPSVGGTINILTKGIDSKRNIRLQQEVGNNGALRTTLGFVSGRLKGGWGISAAASYKQGDGWVDGTFSKGYFYYLKIEKEFRNHLLSVSGFGAPQMHGQRLFKSRIQTFDRNFAVDAGVPDSIADTGKDYGLRYNEHIGTQDGKLKNVRVNYFHKPQFTLRHVWSPQNSFSLSTIAYSSIGNGGGTNSEGGLIRKSDGSIDFDSIYSKQQIGFLGDKKASTFIRSSINNHYWFGLLSTARYELNRSITLSGGVDARYYRGEHYREIYDLLGGEYADSQRNLRTSQSNQITRLGVGDKFYYNYDGHVRWGGLFGLMEYNKGDFTGFINLSSAIVSYKAEDFMWDETFFIDTLQLFATYNRPAEYNGTLYTVDHPSAASIADAINRNLKIDSVSMGNQIVGWVNIPSFTVKAGGTYNVNKSSNVFVNVGYLSRPTQFNNVIVDVYNTNKASGRYTIADGRKNEIITAVEGGYGFKSKMFAGNINAYLTNWVNRPLDNPPTVLEDPSDPNSDRIPVNINGINARHMGIELDFIFRATKQIDIEGLASIGDWRWNSGASTLLPDGSTYSFDAKGVHVGDAAQTQLGGQVRFEPIKGLYFKVKATYFGNNYANFNPEDLRGENAGRDSWQMPDYSILDFHTGYTYDMKKSGALTLRFNLLNVLDTKYIADADNNDNFLTPQYNDFDAKSAAVYFAMGRRWNLSLEYSF
ncbi:MAG: TonB-dependent receptor [Saprospiraceae bacterium]|nr:TonB-dependent receptor [Saprospiraceae bacterium]MBP7679802.1 TonB-dependent receptor [Saprospiraceae bacterium]